MSQASSDITWPELESLTNGATAFRLVLEKDAPRRACVDPRLWDAVALTSLDLCGVGLQRLDALRNTASSDDVVDDEELREDQIVGALDGPRGLPQLTRLRDLLLSDNSLGPMLLPEGGLHGLSVLRSLDLQGNGLEMLPAALVSLTSLTSLNVARNRLTDLPWLSLSLLPELRSLTAPSNQITCISGGESSAMPPRLTEFTLRANQLAGDGGLVVLAQCSALSALDVADNQLTALPSELGSACTKLSRLDIVNNPWDDKKLAKLADGQQDQASAKPILELLRKGQSRRQMKSDQKLVRKQRPPPPRLFATCANNGEVGNVPQQPDAGYSASKKNNKKGKNKAAPPAATTVSVSAEPPRKFITVSRDVLGVRPHILVTLLHVVVDEESENSSEESPAPMVFHAECGSTGNPDESPQEFFDAVEANLGLLERGMELPDGASDAASRAAKTATARLRDFVAVQTRIHADRELGDKRRKGALGSHNASELRWPLRFAAGPHDKVKFSPLSIGWMQEKGVVTALEFAREAAAGRVAGAAKDVALALQKPAAALLQLPLCPHVVDSKGVVLSVHPLSNGWQTRTTADAQGALLLECSSAQSEASCRHMLLALIRETIEIIEGSDKDDDFASRAALLQKRKVRVLLEPVDVVCDWDHNIRRTEFPSYDELLSLPPLPEYCASAGHLGETGQRDSSSDDSD